MLMTGHVGLLILGHNYYLAEMLAGASVVNSAMMFALSTRFHFCMLHRLLIAYPLVVEACIVLQRFDLFGRFVGLARWIVFLVGATLFFCGVIKLHKTRVGL